MRLWLSKAFRTSRACPENKTLVLKMTEDSGLMGEVERCFRIRRCIENNLFMLEGLIEMVKKDEIFVAVVDIEKTYNRVNMK